MSKVVTVILSAVPHERLSVHVSLPDLAQKFNELFGSQDIGTFRLREVHDRIAIDFNNGYDAMNAQRLLDGQTYKFDNNLKFLKARLTHVPELMSNEPLPPNPIVQFREYYFSSKKYKKHLDIEHLKEADRKIQEQLTSLKVKRKLIETKEKLIQKTWKKMQKLKNLESEPSSNDDIQEDQTINRKRRATKHSKSKGHRNSSTATSSSDSDENWSKRKRSRYRKCASTALHDNNNTKAGTSRDSRITPKCELSPHCSKDAVSHSRQIRSPTISRSSSPSWFIRGRSGSLSGRSSIIERSQSRIGRSPSRRDTSQCRRSRSRSRRSLSRCKRSRSLSDRLQSIGRSPSRRARSRSRRDHRSRHDCRSRHGSRSRSKSSRSRTRRRQIQYRVIQRSARSEPSRSRSRQRRSRSKQSRFRSRPRRSRSRQGRPRYRRSRRLDHSAEQQDVEFQESSVPCKAVDYKPNVSELYKPELQSFTADRCKEAIPANEKRISFEEMEAKTKEAVKEIILDLREPLNNLCDKNHTSHDDRKKVLEKMLEITNKRVAKLKLRKFVTSNIVMLYRCRYSKVEDEKLLADLFDSALLTRLEDRDLPLGSPSDSLVADNDEEEETVTTRHIFINVIPMAPVTSKRVYSVKDENNGTIKTEPPDPKMSVKTETPDSDDDVMFVEDIPKEDIKKSIKLEIDKQQQEITTNVKPSAPKRDDIVVVKKTSDVIELSDDEEPNITVKTEPVIKKKVIVKTSTNVGEVKNVKKACTVEQACEKIKTEVIDLSDDDEPMNPVKTEPAITLEEILQLSSIIGDIENIPVADTETSTGMKKKSTSLETDKVRVLNGKNDATDIGIEDNVDETVETIQNYLLTIM